MSHDSLRRKYAKKMAEMRSLEEQMERKNVLYGKGATPSMGLSQYRGGLSLDGMEPRKPSSSCTEEQRRRLNELIKERDKYPIRTMQVTGRDLEIQRLSSACAGPRVDSGHDVFFGNPRLKGSGFDIDQRQIRAFGHYLDDAEMEGGMSHLHNEFRDHRSASDHFAKADQVRKGSGWWDDYKKIKGLPAVPRVPKYQTPPVLNVPKYQTPPVLDYKNETFDTEMKSGGFLDKIPGPVRDKLIKSGLSFLQPTMGSLPMYGNMLFGKQSERKRGGLRTGKYEGEGKGKRRGSDSSSDSVGACGGGKGRSARAQIVKKVMAEKGLSLIEASKYVKAHGLY